MSGVLPYRGHAPLVDASAEPAQRVPATVREAPPGLRAAAGTTLRGTVIGHDPQGHLLVRTAAGVLALTTRLQPARGSTLVMQIQPVGAGIQAYILRVIAPDGTLRQAAGTPAQSNPKAPSTGRGTEAPTSGIVNTDASALTRVWPALAEAVAALGRSRTAPLPRSGPSLAIDMLSMMAALLDPDASHRLNVSLDAALTSVGRADLADRLERDLAVLSRLARTESGDWRIFVIPVVAAAGEARLLRLFLRPSEAGADRPVPRRFVVEADLPPPGPFQLEGLVHEKRLELILRSTQPLAGPLKEQLVAVHARAAALGGLSGDLRFADDGEWSFIPIPHADADDHGVVI